MLYEVITKAGRKTIDPNTIALIREMSRANPLWGAPRIHGELRSACDFLPLAEQTGLVLELDRAMLRQVCSWLSYNFV